MPPITITIHLTTLSDRQMYMQAQSLPLPASCHAQASQRSPTGLSTALCPLSTVATTTLHHLLVVEIIVVTHQLITFRLRVTMVMATDGEGGIVWQILQI